MIISTSVPACGIGTKRWQATQKSQTSLSSIIDCVPTNDCKYKSVAYLGPESFESHVH